MFRTVLVPLLASALLAVAPSGPPSEISDTPCPATLQPALQLTPAAFRPISLSEARTGDACPRLQAGSIAAPPPDLFSQNGVLSVELFYTTMTDQDGRTLYCFHTADGQESPTLHVRPGDILEMTVRNAVPPQVGEPIWPTIAAPTAICGAARQTPSSVNVHFHGTNTAPVCHADSVIHTIINSGQTFRYRLRFPADEPPGLYWYHPHIYGLAEAAVQGGATGAIIVEGIEAVQPAVVGLPERILVIRDQVVTESGPPGSSPPAWDLSLNYVPVSFPAYTPAVIQMRTGQQEFWRLANTAAGTILDIQLLFDGVPQPLKIVGLDGVPVGSQDGTGRGTLVTQNHILIPPAGRAEFIVEGPGPEVRNAVLQTLAVDTGPDGDADPQRPIAVIEQTAHGLAPRRNMPATSASTAGSQRFAGLDDAPVSRQRHLYFSENDTGFFISVEGATPTLFNPANPPAIITKQGSVEEWTIENRTAENHEFHIHQLHFELLQRNGVDVPESERQFLDTVDIPYWTGSGPYPSVTVRMDFRGADVGDFVYHCHILEHEDNGMMAIIRVLPRT